MLCLKFCLNFFQMDLMPFINKAGCECLNESDEHGFDNCLRKDPTFLESDCDEQVMGCVGQSLWGDHRLLLTSVSCPRFWFITAVPVPDSCL